jgi:hypothetical protein
MVAILVRNWKFESGPLEQRVCELSVPVWARGGSRDSRNAEPIAHRARVGAPCFHFDLGNRRLTEVCAEAGERFEVVPR